MCSLAMWYIDLQRMGLHTTDYMSRLAILYAHRSEARQGWLWPDEWKWLSMGPSETCPCAHLSTTPCEWVIWGIFPQVRPVHVERTPDMDTEGCLCVQHMPVLPKGEGKLIELSHSWVYYSPSRCYAADGKGSECTRHVFALMHIQSFL